MNDKQIFPVFFNTSRFDAEGIDMICSAIMRATKQGCENKPVFSSKFTQDDNKMEAVGYASESKNGLPYVKFTIKPDTFVPTPRTTTSEAPRNAPDAGNNAPLDDDDIPF